MSKTKPTKAQLARQLLALHATGLDIVKDISLDSVLERIGRVAIELSSAQYAAVGVLDEKGNLERFIPVGMNQAEVDLIAHLPQGLGLIGEVMRSREPICLDDLESDPRAAGFPPLHPAMTSFLGVPILYGDRTLGLIYITNKQKSPCFDENDQTIIQLMANYAGAAISNARQYRDLTVHDRIMTRRFENQQLMNKLASTLATSTDIDQIVDNGLTQLMGYLQLDVGEVFLRQEDSRKLILNRHIGGSMNNLWRREQFLIGEGTIGKAAQSGIAEVLNLAEQTSPDLDPDISLNQIDKIAITPLNGRGGVLGVMCVATTRPRTLDDVEFQFLQAIASWMATAIENVRLNISERRLAVLEERERFGMDLHDGIIQSVYAVGLTLEHARLLLNDDPEMAASRIDQAIHDLDSTIRDIRAYILDLRPRQMHNETIMQGVQRLVHEFKSNTLIEVSLDGPADGFEALPEDQTLALFHICQESLANIAKHAHAHHVQVQLWKTNDRALLEIHDDGQGFNPDQIHKAIGHGLSNMQTRAANAGGEVDITSEIGAGSTVLAWVPLPENELGISE